ncbi:HAD-IB family phosphatase [Candidatus Peregrinibacteria bacterium]|jgi:phosphoserine phosphatase|nr:HAD-IB family phosphatase [Candidatus Peregrinibacteria bacterium]MBT7483598.1 HAD-IB family phosphatase [Candidatus Peregrinibacteria bacterium]MBT7702631.1 HAD-IB family phosphatase [Candidatus Peregrinibacteria bacterium]
MFQQIFFDCDSTLTTIEGIDELTADLNLKEQIQNITKKAMLGQIDFKTALIQRLFLLNPTKKDLQRIGEQYIKNIFPGTKKLINLFKSNQREVYIVSGGFKTAILPFAKHLGIPPENVFANEIIFDQKGQFEKLNTKNILIHTNGKAQFMRSHRILNPHKKTVFIGDGITDLATKPFVDRFIGFGSTQSRPEVKNQSPYFFQENNLLKLLPFLT